MNIKKQFAGLLLLALLCSGCHQNQSQEPEPTEAIPETTVLPSETVQPATEPTTQAPTEPKIPSYPAEPLDYEPVENSYFEYHEEAEDLEYSGMLFEEDLLNGYSGTGYLSGFTDNDGENIKSSFYAPTSQHYDITVCACADSPVTNALTVNGKVIGEFTLTEPQQFTRITFSGVYLPEGETTISIKEMDGYFSLDYFEVTNSQKMQSLSYRADYPLSDAEASEGAQEFMRWLSLNYGTKIVSGQYVSGSDNQEMEVIHRLTGKYPAIRFADVGCYTENSSSEKTDVVGDSLEWAENGGIVGLMWYWDAPEGISSVYADETNFRLKDAIPAPAEIPPETTEPTTEPEDESEDEDRSEADESAEFDVGSVAHGAKSTKTAPCPAK